MPYPPLNLQDPTDPNSPYLQETLLEKSLSARGGAALFAWATKAGIDLFVRDSVFEQFLAQYEFQLVVGMDSVTDLRALDALIAADEEFDELTVSIFLPEDPSPMFHPKATWFRRGNDSGTLIVGSGNLTGGGLRGNFEAYSVCPLSPDEMRQTQTTWSAWLDRHAQSLRRPTEEEVRTQAERNVRQVARPRAQVPTRRRLPIVATDDVVLLAEIPRSGNRWKQANFDRESYENYFGARVGTQRRIILRQVDEQGQLRELEVRPSVEVASRNWRFELEAAAGLDYPDAGRPIGVFLRVKPRTFVYQLLMPDNAEHTEVSTYLDAEEPRAGARMRRISRNLNEAGHLGPVRRLADAIRSTSVTDDDEVMD